MTSPERFHSAEWKLLLQAPEAAGMAVLAAQSEGALKERQAMLEAWAHSSSQPFADSQIVLALIRGRDAVGDEWHFWNQGDDGLEKLDPRRTLDAALKLCGDALALLKERATAQEVEDYRRWILFIGDHVANATKEGGFLGLGGKRVSPEEQAALNELSAALKSA